MQLIGTRAIVLIVVLVAGPGIGCGSSDADSQATTESDPFGNASDPGAGNGGAVSMGAGAGTASGGIDAAMAVSTGGSPGASATADGGAPADDAGANDPAASQDAAAPGVGTQPRGAACANDGNCSQAMGDAVCCVNTCTLASECSGGVVYLKCVTGSDCAAFGGGKLCCEMGPMRFCTKRSACSGQVIP